MSARVVCWFSCGVTSAVAAKLALEQFSSQHEVRVAYCETHSEHEDNARFLTDCEDWLGVSIERLESPDYKDVWDVWDRTGWLVGPQGARCTIELKKRVRMSYQRADDIQVFGFDASEKDRAARFRRTNHEIDLRTPLIDRNFYKRDCVERLRAAGIRTPAIYDMGYRNANCIGCVKGQQGYWNKIRVDFPDVFDRMAAMERKLDVAINKTYAGTGKRQRVFLDELDPSAGQYEAEPAFDCGLLCADGTGEEE